MYSKIYCSGYIQSYDDSQCKQNKSVNKKDIQYVYKLVIMQHRVCSENVVVVSLDISIKSNYIMWSNKAVSISN